MRRVSLVEFHAALRAQGVTFTEDLAFICPVCRTIQSGRDLIAAGAGNTFDDVERYVGFSCVGRFTDAGPHRRGTPPGKGCDWTLGGFFKVHRLEVVDAGGVGHPRFELATPEEAQDHATRGLRAIAGRAEAAEASAP